MASSPSRSRPPAPSAVLSSDTATVVVGEASVTATANTIAGGYAVAASASGVATLANFSLTNTAGPATQLEFVDQPTDTTYGDAIAPAVTVEVLDQYSNLVNSTASVSVAFQNNPTGAALAGAIPVLAVGGIATFNDLTVSKVGTAYTLVATSAGLSAAPTSNPFDITPRPILVTAAANTKVYDGTTTAAAAPTITGGSLVTGDTAVQRDLRHEERGHGQDADAERVGQRRQQRQQLHRHLRADTTGVITAEALTVTAAANTKVYDGTTTAAAVPTITGGSLATRRHGRLQRDLQHEERGHGPDADAERVRSTTATAATTTPYTFVPDTTGVITAAALTVTAATNTKVYDGTTTAAAIADDHRRAAWPRATRPTSARPTTRKNVGTGLTLTPSGFGQRRQRRQQLHLHLRADHDRRDHGRGTHGHGGDQHQGLRRHDDARRRRRRSPRAAWPRSTRPTSARPTARKNVGTGLTLTPSGSVNDGNSGNNYTFTFVPVSTGVITAEALTITAATNTKVYDGTTTRGGDADDHRGQPGHRRHGRLHRDLQHQERGHGQDADAERVGQRRQRRQQLHATPSCRCRRA